jgi:hypothetical protein
MRPLGIVVLVVIVAAAGAAFANYRSRAVIRRRK